MPVVVLWPSERPQLRPFTSNLFRVSLPGAVEVVAADQNAPPAGGAGTGDPAAPVVAESEKAVAQADFFWWGFGLVVIVVGIFLGQWIYDKPATQGENYNEFALFYLFAQTLERLSEFISYIPRIGARIGLRPNAASKPGSIDKETAHAKMQLAPVESAIAYRAGDRLEATAKAEEAANAVSDADFIQSNRAVAFFAINTFLAALGCGYLGLRFLHTIGISDVRPWVDIAISALAIGGGSVPLHDLTKSLEKKNDPTGDAAS